MTSLPQHISYKDNLATMEAMLRQESSGYNIPDYLRNLPTHSEHGQPIDSEARFSIAEWCFKIMDICKYSRETAAIVMSCLDRYVSTSEGYHALLDRRKFQLSALSCIYTVVKVHEQQALAPALVSKLSHGVYSAEDVEATEMKILMALKWRVNPPTALEFVRNALQNIPSDILDEATGDMILDLVQKQIDSSVLYYDLSMQQMSKIAFASLLNAVESVTDDMLLASYVESITAKATNINSHHFIELRDRLYEFLPSRATMHAYQTALSASKSKQQPQQQSCSSAYSSNSGTSFRKSPISVQMS